MCFNVIGIDNHAASGTSWNRYHTADTGERFRFTLDWD